jgi:hypothetical protein
MPSNVQCCPQKFMADIDKVVLDNQRVLLSFSQDYQINAASQGTWALQQQAAHIQQQRLEQQQKLLQQQYQQHSSKAGSILQLQLKQRQQQHSATLQDVPGRTSAAAASSGFLAVQRGHPEVQKQDEDTDEVVLISDSDNEQSEQQQDEDGDRGHHETEPGAEQQDWAYRQVVNGHIQQDGTEEFESGVGR